MKPLKNKQKTRVILFGMMLALTVAFIFSNSLKNGAESNADSGRLASMITPLIEAIFGEGRVNVNFVVRKSAHFAEFAVLGLLTGATLHAVYAYSGKKLPFCGLFGTLAVAVTDEYIQLFTGRTSSVGDVLIDFSGAITGMLAVLLICLLTGVIRKERRKNENEA